MLIFVLQSVWLYISELAGKELEIDIIFKFLLFVTPRLVVLVLPLTILLASIMVFGSFAENYEFAAMKSTGISLQRAMRSLSFFIVALAVLTFFFANNVIPAAEFKFHNLRKNIAKVKPAMAIAEGQFNQIGEINIKVEKKTGDRGQFLEDVIIHQKKGKSPGNYVVIKSKTGELASKEDSDVLQLILYDGYYHDDIQPKKYEERRRRPHVKSYFEKYTLNIDLSNLNKVDFDDAKVSSKYSMLTISGLDVTIDSLQMKRNNERQNISNTMHTRSAATTLSSNINPVQDKDTKVYDASLLDLFKAKNKSQIVAQALGSVKSTLQIIEAQERKQFGEDKNINKHIIAFHEKFALGLACIILFFVGAPLGALIKKGGMGLPIVIAIILFLTYHFIGIFAKNSAEDSSLNPIIASWLSTLIMLPLSIYLTSRATKDRPLMNMDGLLIPIKKLLGKKALAIEINNTLLDTHSDDYHTLESYTDSKLIDIIKNYRQYDMDVEFKNSSIQILEARGITRQELKYAGNLTNDSYENALSHKNTYENNAVVSFRLYVIMAICAVIGLVLNNNGFPQIGIGLVVIGAIAALFYLTFLFNAFDSLSKFYKNLDKKINVLAIYLLGMPFYFLLYFYFKKKLKEDIQQIR
jgi:lipopolysaccharide export system permease protein